MKNLKNVLLASLVLVVICLTSWNNPPKQYVVIYLEPSGSFKYWDNASRKSISCSLDEAMNNLSYAGYELESFQMSGDQYETHTMVIMSK